MEKKNRMAIYALLQFNLFLVSEKKISIFQYDPILKTKSFIRDPQ